MCNDVYIFPLLLRQISVKLEFPNSNVTFSEILPPTSIKTPFTYYTISAIISSNK